VLPQDANIGDVLQALRERLQLQHLEVAGESPMQLRLLLLDGSRQIKLLKPTDTFSDGFEGGVFNRDDLLNKSVYHRREDKLRVLLEYVPQVFMQPGIDHSTMQ
jgi:hypothetical protein